MKAAKPKRHGTQQSLNAAVKSICDVMRRSNCAGAMKYVPELTWILFLRILDEREAQEAEEADALNISFVPSLQAPFRWRDWAAPESALRQDKNAKIWDFVHGQLLPHLKALEKQPGATGRQKIVSEVMSSVERSRIDFSVTAILNAFWDHASEVSISFSISQHLYITNAFGEVNTRSGAGALERVSYSSANSSSISKSEGFLNKCFAAKRVESVANTQINFSGCGFVGRTGTGLSPASAGSVFSGTDDHRMFRAGGRCGP